MAIMLYMDQHVERAITVGLCARGVDVLTAYEDGADRLADADLLDRANASGRVLFTRDDDLLSEAASDIEPELSSLASFMPISKRWMSARACASWR